MALWRYEQALEYADLTLRHSAIAGSYASIPVMHFYIALTHLALQNTSSENQQQLDTVREQYEKLGYWGNYGQMNYLHKFQLMEAEKYRVLGQKTEAIELYDQAIAGAKENEFIQEEALANELAARFYLDWGKERVAAGYMQEAYYCYSRWGAKTKTDDLAKRYPDLLKPILQQPRNSLTSLETLSLVTPNLSIHTSTETGSNTRTSVNEVFDFTAILQASQALTRTIKLDELLGQLTKIILQQSGSDHCALILPEQEENWQVRAFARGETIEISLTPLEGNPNLPVKLIRYVTKTQECVVIEGLDTDLPVIDEYLRQEQPKSVLCLPILNQGKSIGILYLSNQSTKGVFNRDRILILNFLCTQAAISIENAHLYEDLENYSQNLEQRVKERTTTLQERETRLNLALRATNQGFFDLNLRTDEAIVSNEYALMLGYDPATFRESAASWNARLHPDDQERVSKAYRDYESGKASQYEVEFRQRTRQGNWKWILSVGKFIEWDAQGQAIRMLGTHTDISDRKLAQSQLEAQNEILGKIAKDEPLSEILKTLIYKVENKLHGSLCSVLIAENDNTLGFGAGPSLPSDYNQAVDGILIGEGIGSCGTSAFRNEVVIVCDIAADPLWKDFRDLALSYGLRSCWSGPITASDGRLLGTFAIYHRDVRSPQEQEIEIIMQMSDLAGIAIERKQAEGKIRQSQAALLEAQEVAHIGNWEIDVHNKTITFSDELFRMYGLEPNQLELAYNDYTNMCYSEEERRLLEQCIERAIQNGTSYTIDYKILRSDGTIRYHECRGEVEKNKQGEVTRLFGTALDISDRKLAQSQLEAQNELLGKIAKDKSLSEVLETLISRVENKLHGSLCSVLLIENGKTLRFGAGPSLPSDYNQAVDGILIGEGVGSCGTAAFRNEVVIVADIATDPLWENFKELALGYGLRACWSGPITASDGRVLGTFAIYHQEVRAPQEQEIEIIMQMTDLAGIAIERQQAEGKLRKSQAALLEAQEVAHIGNWEIDVHSKTISFSEELFRMYGLESEQLELSYEDYLEMCYVEEERRLLQQCIERAMQDGTSYTIDYRVLQPNGTIRYHECRGEVEKNKQGKVTRLFGTALDISDRKQAEITLQNLIEGTAATTGQDFFPALVTHLAEALHVSYAFVGEKVGNQMRTAAFWSNGILQPSSFYEPENTPCQKILQNGRFYCKHSVQEQFPGNSSLVKMGVESYLGLGLQNTNGDIIGTLCIFDQQPIQDPQRAEQILHVFAARATAELERQKAEVESKRQMAAMEAAIDGIGISQGDNYLYVNQAYLNLYGYESHKKMLGKTWQSSYTPETVNWFKEEIFPYLEQERAWQGEALATRRDGSTFIEELSLTLTEDNLLIRVCRDISARKQAEIALQNLIEGTAATTGQDFFPALAKHIAEALNIDYAIVTELIDDKLHALAFWANGSLQPTFAYHPATTPCEITLRDGKFFCACLIQQRFPDDIDLVQMEAESYLGIALKGSNGQSIGNLCVLSKKQIQDPPRAEQIMRVFAARAATELERQRGEAAIKRQMAAMEAAIDGISISQNDTYIYVNQAHLDLYGYENQEEMLEQTWQSSYAPETVNWFEQEVLPNLERKRAWQGEAIATRRDGSTFAEELSLTLTEDNLLIRVCRDISERKEAEIALQNLIEGTAATTGEDFFPA